jgi:hypothetical protein
MACPLSKEAMMKPSALSAVLNSRILLLVLILGNITLGLTTFVQSQVITGQKNLIRLLYSDSAELTSMKVAANIARGKKH